MLVFYLLMIESERDKSKFTEIYSKYKNLYYYVALKVTKNNAMAEDAVHNALITIIEHKNELFQLPDEKFKSTTVIIVKNKAIDILRKENIREHKSFDELSDSGLSDDLDVTTIIENKEGYDILINAIESLPEKYKSVFYLRYVYGIGNQAIGEYLGLKPKTVSMRISRAKIMLREILSKGNG